LQELFFLIWQVYRGISSQNNLICKIWDLIIILKSFPSIAWIMFLLNIFFIYTTRNIAYAKYWFIWLCSSKPPKSWMYMERYWWEVTLISGSVNLPLVNDSKIIGNYRSKPTTSVNDSEIIVHPAMISDAWPWNGRKIWLLYKQRWSYSFIGEGFIIYVLLML